MIPTQSTPNAETLCPTTFVQVGATPGEAQVVAPARSPGKLLVTPEEATEILSIGRTTIYELMATGSLESVQIKSCRRIPVAALERFVQRLLEGTQQRPH